MDADLDTLATALYVSVDDLLKARPGLAPTRPRVGIEPETTDAELITLSVLQVLQGYDSENRWLRHAHQHLRGWFPRIPRQPGYNKRLRALCPTMAAVMRHLARSTTTWWDDVWVADSTPVECGRSRETVKRSRLAGYAEYGYCASHSRLFWGMRLHLLATPSGLPVAAAVTGAKADERQVLLDMLDSDPDLDRPGQHLMADKNYFGREFETDLAATGIDLIRPSRRGEAARPGRHILKALRQIIESTFWTAKGQLGLERHHAKTLTGLHTRMAQRLLALTTVIWHNERTDHPVTRSLTPYDH